MLKRLVWLSSEQRASRRLGMSVMKPKVLFLLPLMWSSLGCSDENVGDSNANAAVCGNGVLEDTEECDGIAPSGQTCETHGYAGGVLGCTDICEIDESQCELLATCGNGQVDPDEACDDDDLVGASCADQGFDGGSLACTVTCSFDTSACHVCGDAVAAGPEQCDGSDYSGETCLSAAGLPQGLLSCAGDCTLDLAGCYDCGNGVPEGPESCDGSALGGETCQSQAGLAEGELACDASCMAFDIAACHTCGNNVTEGPEACDGVDLGVATCSSVTGHSSGNLDCTASCALATDDCHTCGNGTIEGPEVCDGYELGSETCQTAAGLAEGQLLCGVGCLTFDVDGCRECANGLCEVGEIGTCPSDCLVSPITAGSQHSCAIGDDGTPWCWGDGGEGRLGDGSTAYHDVLQPAPVLNLVDAVVVSAGSHHTCALKAGGTVWCWGDASRLGTGATQDSAVPVHVSGLSAAVSVSAGDYHSCALVSDGTVWCWGSNSVGQLGNGTSQSSYVPVQVIGLSNVVSLSAGGGSTCAAKSDGSIWCWGDNTYGQLGDNQSHTSCSFTDCSNLPVQTLLLTGAVDVSVGDHHSCAVLGNGSTWCWGKNDRGQLGTSQLLGQCDGQDCSRLPLQVASITDAASIAAGYTHTCVLTSAGASWCWGSNSHGQLGDGSLVDRSLPVLVSGLGAATHLDAGWNHSCARLADASFRCWGSIVNGRLGTGHVAESWVPVPVGLTTDASTLTADYRIGCGTLADGTARCWGNNLYGQLGDGTTHDSSLAKEVVGLGGVTSISSSSSVPSMSWKQHHTCAGLLDGSAWCWGVNAWGQLGDGQSHQVCIGGHDCSILPVQVTGLSGVTAVATGGNHTCAVLDDGTVWCWGNNFSNQLGDNQSHVMCYDGHDCSPVPVQVLGLTGVTDLSAGYVHTCALRNDGTLWCWGSNSFGALGDGTTTSSGVPVQVVGIQDGVAITAGGAHTCAIRTDSTAWCWGRNSDGQLGDGLNHQSCFGSDCSPMPVEITQLTAVTSISAGNTHSCVTQADGTAWCWGDGENGRLGTGSDNNSAVPLAVSGITNATGVAAGYDHTCALLGDGTAWCWGSSEEGQLGNPNYWHQLSPAVVVGL